MQHILSNRRIWWMIIIGVLAVALARTVGPQIWAIVQDEVALEAFVAQLGVWGPPALIALNAAQIVAAPLPGYVMQIAAGYLYGPVWGGVYGSIGLIIGAMLAMTLARSFGRPLVEQLVGAGRLERWERVTFSTNTLVWFAILLAPTGDLPYFMAGLARVSFAKILLLTLVIRVPSTMVVAAAGAGVWLLPGWQLAIVLAALGIATVLLIRYQERLLALVDRRVQRQLSREELL
jgi:uncharacterized membrane protein YdjX (TVP38/TMEM64 family)